MDIFMYFLSAIIGYLLGTVSTGTLVARLYGRHDLRKTGSGNTGTTNVLRTLGWLPSLLTLTGDCLKGVFGALIGRWLGGEVGMLIGGACAVAGHDFPVFTGFKGGKGIATSLGATFVVCTPVAPLLLLITIVFLLLTRIMSVGTLCASISYLPLMLLFRSENLPLPHCVVFSLALTLLSFARHHANIRRLIHHEENKLDFDKIGRLSQKYQLFRKKKK